jgi:PilZ domain
MKKFVHPGTMKSHSNSPSAPMASGKTRNSERRASVRYAASQSCGCHSLGEGNEDHWSAAIRDVSSEGLSLVVCHAFCPGEILTIELDDAPEGMRRKLFVRVKHAAEQGDSLWVLGCRFVNRLNEGELEHLR